MAAATIAVVVSVSVLGIAVIAVLVWRCLKSHRSEAATEETNLLHEMDVPANVPYQILRQLGDGTYGTVYLAKRQEDAQLVAVKVVPCSKERQAEDALREYTMCLQVQGHENVVKLLDLFQDTPVNDRGRGMSTTTLKKLPGVRVPKGNTTAVCTVTEYYAKGTLFDLLVRHRRETGQKGLPEDQVWEYTRQLLRALEFMHAREVIHRDVKPSNVLVSDDERRLALTDFGLSKEMAAGEYVKTRIGTYHYMAPEQMTGTKYNAKADIWAVGCLVYAMCTSKVSTRDALVMFSLRKTPEFERRLRSDIRGRYSDQLADFMLRLLMERPQDRPTSAEALSAALEAGCAHTPRN